MYCCCCLVVVDRYAVNNLERQLNNTNFNNLIYKVPYGHNFRGTGGMADRFACRLKCLIKHASIA